ncbi:MAG: SGNH/GDSL hydrolase family protein [Opitutaceae bacterium]|jgi:lysophospholipase L1-like esterase
MKLSSLLVLTACGFCLLQAKVAGNFGPQPFSDGTRYAAVGDSITHHGLYPLYLEAFYRTRFPTRKVDFINLGISGDTVAGGLVRYPWDIQPEHASVASVFFGMNDVSRNLYQTGKSGPELERQRLAKINEYEANLRILVARLKVDGVKVILVTPTVYDDTSTKAAPSGFEGVNDALTQCGKRAELFAKEQNIPLVDFNTPMRDLTRRLQSADPAATLIGADRTHPQAPGHLLVTALFLEAQGLAGDVWRIAIDADAVKIREAFKCRVENVVKTPNTIEFQYIADSLPFPVEEAAASALDWFPFTEKFNREVLSVTGLEAGRYRLKIDGRDIRGYSSAELALGINLVSESSAPEVKQAKRVWALIQQRANYVRKKRDIVMVEFQAARDLPRPLTLAEIEPLLAVRLQRAIGGTSEPFIRRTGADYLVNKSMERELELKAREIERGIYEAARPGSHRIEIVRSDVMEQ